MLNQHQSANPEEFQESERSIARRVGIAIRREFEAALEPVDAIWEKEESEA